MYSLWQVKNYAGIEQEEHWIMTDTKAEAIDEARRLWGTMAAADKKRVRLEIRKYINPSDYEIIEW